MIALLTALQLLTTPPVPARMSVRIDVPIKAFPPGWPVVYELLVRNGGKAPISLDPDTWSDFVPEHRSRDGTDWHRCIPISPVNARAYEEYRSQLPPVVIGAGQALSLGFHYMEDQCNGALLPSLPGTVVVRLYGKILGVTLWSNESELTVQMPTEFDRAILERRRIPADVPQSLLSLPSYLSFRGKTRATLVSFDDGVFTQTRFPDGSPNVGALERLKREVREKMTFVTTFSSNPFNDELKTDVAIDLLALHRRSEALDLLVMVEKRAAHRETREKARLIIAYLNEHPNAGISD